MVNYLESGVIKLHPLRLQTGMRGAFGKPQGTVARVHIGQVIMSIRSKEQHLGACQEALRRAKFKFPGRQKVCGLNMPACVCPIQDTIPLQIYISNKWGFTKWTKEEFREMMQEGRLRPDGVGVQYLPEHGPLKAWKARQTA